MSASRSGRSAAADGEADAGESVWIGFGALPTGVTVGGTPATTVAIRDSDDTTVDPPVTVLFTGGGGGGGGPSSPTPSEIDFEWNVTRDIEELDRDHGDPTGAWSDSVTLWIAENGDGAADAVYTYDLASGERVEELEFELDDGNLAPRGLWSDRSTIWVSDSGKEKLFAHDLASGERLPDSDLALHDDNDDARGIWSDGSTMWVVDGRDKALFGYDLKTGELLAEYELDDDNDDPHGIWSDRVGVWVSDHNDKRLFAYRLPTLKDDTGEDAAALDRERVTDEEFTKLSRASNNSPRGLWSVGDGMHVADASDSKVYTHNMPGSIDARLASLTLSGVDIGEFSPGQREYEGVADEGVTQTTVEALAVQLRATVVIEPPDTDKDADGHRAAVADGHQATVADGAEIADNVTSEDESRTKVYRVRIGEMVAEEAEEPDPKPEAGAEPSADAEEASPEAASPSLDCLRGLTPGRFSLVTYEGGSVDDLDACARSKSVVAVYVWSDGAYVSYILGAPEFVNRAFRDNFPAGLAPVTPLIAKREPPAAVADAAAPDQ